MKRILTVAPAVLIVLGIMFTQAAPASADEWGPRDHYRHHHYARLAYAGYVPGEGACRVGWWQSLRYGHVRPVWASWCR